MPFRSAKQRKFLFSQRPEVARRFARKYGTAIKQRKRRKRRK